MNISLKTVNELPLTKLWNEDGIIQIKRERNLKKNELTEMLKKYPVEFVIANIGEKLKWISVDKCFDSWKSDIKHRIVDNFEKIDLENYPKEFAYIASEWKGQIQTPIILLEKYH